MSHLNLIGRFNTVYGHCSSATLWRTEVCADQVCALEGSSHAAKGTGCVELLLIFSLHGGEEGGPAPAELVLLLL